MPELYPGQAEVVADNLAELELYQRADEERLKATEDPNARATILDRMAGRTSTIAATRRQLAGMDGEAPEGPERSERTESLRIRLSPTEKQALQDAAAETGRTVAGYVRRMCGIG